MFTIVFCFCIFAVTGIGGTIIQKPLNVATHVGGNTFFNCTSNRSSTNAIMWIYNTEENPNVGRTVLTEGACDVQSSLAANFKTEKLGEGNVCNLIIFNAAISHGGFYTCDDRDNFEGTAQSILILVDSISSFSYSMTDEIVSAENLTISKTVAYGAPSKNPPYLMPLFYWTLQLETTRNVTSSSIQTANTSSSSIIITAQKEPIPVHVCNLFFDLPVKPPPSCAVNAPTYRESWPTELIEVSYPPEDVTIKEECNGNNELVLTCSASGYPSPSYTWTNLTDNMIVSVTNQALIRYGHEGLCRCNATNEIRGTIEGASTVSYVNGDTCKLLCAQLGIPDDGCIALLVILPLISVNICAMAVFLLVYGLNDDFQERLNRRFERLKEMLPCFNEGCKCSGWIVAFVAMSVLGGIVAFPTLSIMALCSCCNTKGVAHSE